MAFVFSAYLVFLGGKMRAGQIHGLLDNVNVGSIADIGSILLPWRTPWVDRCIALHAVIPEILNAHQTRKMMCLLFSLGMGMLFISKFVRLWRPTDVGDSAARFELASRAYSLTQPYLRFCYNATHHVVENDAAFGRGYQLSSLGI